MTINTDNAVLMVTGIITGVVVINHCLPGRSSVAVITLTFGHEMVPRFIMAGITRACYPAVVKPHVRPIGRVMAVTAYISGL